MRVGYSATVRALWLSAGHINPTVATRLLDRLDRCSTTLSAQLSTVPSSPSASRSHSRPPSPRRSELRLSSTLFRLSSPRLRRFKMAAVYTLSAETSLNFLEHYITRLTHSKLQCSYTEHQPTPSFTCTLSIAVPPPSSRSAAPVLLTCTSSAFTQKKQAKAAAALLLCRELIDRGEFEPFAVSGQPDKFAFSSKREKRFHAERHPTSASPVAFAVHPNKEAVARTSPKPLRSASFTSSSAAVAPSTVPSASAAVAERDRARDRMVLLSGLNAAEQLTASDITQRLSVALQHCPIVHPYQSATHPQYTTYLLQFNSPAEAEDAAIILDGRDDIIDGPPLTAHMLDKPAEVMIDRAWYSPPQQLSVEWLGGKNEAGDDCWYFFGYRCDLFDDGQSPYSLALLCPSALPAIQPLTLYPLLAASLTAANCADQKARQFAVRYAGSCRLSEQEMAVATRWWARMAKDLGKRGDGQWHQEQRRYLLLPVLREPASKAAAVQPANDAQLIASFSSTDDTNRPARLQPDWALINRSLFDGHASLSPSHFDADHRTLSTVLLHHPTQRHRIPPTPPLTNSHSRQPLPHPRQSQRRPHVRRLLHHARWRGGPGQPAD